MPRIVRPIFKVYRFKRYWHWILKASNGQAYAKSVTPYTSKRGCVRAVEAMQNLVPMCRIEVDG
jgi:uncharacterized protein YegP (UPF0339 family)